MTHKMECKWFAGIEGAKPQLKRNAAGEYMSMKTVTYSIRKSAMPPAINFELS